MDKPVLKSVSGLKDAKIFKKIKQSARVPNLCDVLFFVISVLCGRATLLDSLTPFGGAFFASVFASRKTYIYMFGAVLGKILSGSALSDIGKYIFAMTVFALICEKLPHDLKKVPSVKGATFTFALVLSGLCFGFYKGATRIASYYDLMLLFVECVVAFCATCAFSVGVPVLKRMKLSYSFTSSEEISLVALIGCALWGAKNISDFYFINLSEIGCILVILTFAIRLGSSKGAVAGLVMGFVSALGSGRIDISCVSYAFSGLTAGILGHYGALCGSAGFILANALITALANGSTEVLINIYDIFFACIIYSLIPEKVFLRLTSFGARDEINRLAEDEKRYGEHIISNAMRTVATLSKSFELISTARESENETEMRFFERIARRSCTGCGMRRLCWSRDLKNTMNSFRYALGEFCDTGKVNSALLPQNCMRPKEMREAFVRFSELYRNDILWQGKIQELKKASSNHMSAFSEILSASGRMLSSSETFDRALADEISRKMQESSICASNVVVMRDEELDPSVFLTLSPCGGFSLCDRGVADILSSACGVKMIRAGKRDCASCRVRYVPAPEGGVVFASRKKARDKKHISGDCAIFRVINKSLYAAVLTDGMGYGEKAYVESKNSAEMLLDLLEIGVDGEKAMKIVNSMLIPYGEASFSTADLCLYDPYSHRAKIIKCGSAASFAKSGESVDAIYSKSLPLGSHIKPSIDSFTLNTSSGDILLLISDGVLESGSKDTWLINELEKFSDNDPGRLADLICEKAMEKCQMTPKDDITVLAAYIE